MGASQSHSIGGPGERGRGGGGGAGLQWVPAVLTVAAREARNGSLQAQATASGRP